MKKIMTFLLSIFVLGNLGSQVISKTEQQFWNDYSKGSIEALEKYVETGFLEKNYWYKDSPLLLAINNGRYDVADFLLEKKVRQRIELDDNSYKDILDYLIEMMNTKGIEYLIEKRGNIDEKSVFLLLGKKPDSGLFLKILGLYGDVNRLVQIDLSYGRDGPYVQTISNLLIEAVRNRNIEYTNILLEHHANANNISYSLSFGELIYGKAKAVILSPLDIANGNKSAEISKLLQSAGGLSSSDLIANNRVDQCGIIKKIESSNFPKFVASERTEIKELSRDKSFSVGSVSKGTPVILLQISESRGSGEGVYYWYYVYSQGIYGWLSSSRIDRANQK